MSCYVKMNDLSFFLHLFLKIRTSQRRLDARLLCNVFSKGLH